MTQATIRKRCQIAGTRPGRVDEMRGLRNRVVRLPVRNGRLYPDDGKRAGIDALAAVLSKIERGGLTAGQQDRHTAVPHDRTRTHPDIDPIHRREMTVYILELKGAVAAGARGVIGHVAKFCDPYLARLPFVREVLSEKGLPFLFLESDLTLRSMGQQRTRIEAFLEMLGGDR